MSEHLKIKITVVKVFKPEEVFADSPFPEMDLGPCEKHYEGQVFHFSQDKDMPRGFCSSAWGAIFPFIITMIYGGDFHGYYKHPGVGVFCCPDGLRPVIFKLELE
jgi:uncharacterized repeat protein (TIGR04076 family)